MKDSENGSVAVEIGGDEVTSTRMAMSPIAVKLTVDSTYTREFGDKRCENNGITPRGKLVFKGQNER